MQRNALIIAALLILCGCESNQERMVKDYEKRIATTIHHDWRTGIPLDGLATVRGYCGQMPELKGCEDVQVQLEDISISLTSCQADQNSVLCRAFVSTVNKHPISSLLPKTYAVELPHTPFYWTMPTEALQAQEGNFGYRREAAYWWWRTWSSLLISCIALFFTIFTAWKIYTIQREKKKKRKYQVAQQKAALAKQERIRKDQVARARAEAEQRANQEREAAIADQSRISKEQAAKRMDDEAAARLAAERAEAASLLDSVFRSSNSKRDRA